MKRLLVSLYIISLVLVVLAGPVVAQPTDESERHQILEEEMTTSYVSAQKLQNIYAAVAAVGSPLVVFTVLSIFAILLVIVVYLTFGMIVFIMFLKE